MFSKFNFPHFSLSTKAFVLAQSVEAYSIGSANYLNVSLPNATGNKWSLSVAYDDGFQVPWFGWATAISVFVLFVLSIV